MVVWFSEIAPTGIEELSKCVDIEGIPVEYRHEVKNQPLSEEQLPAEFCEERASSRIPF